MLFRQKPVPRVPLLAWTAHDIGDVITPPEQFNLGLGLVIPVTASPGPRIAGRRGFWGNHNAANLALCCRIRSEMLSLRRLERCDRQGLIVHDKVVPGK